MLSCTDNLRKEINNNSFLDFLPEAVLIQKTEKITYANFEAMRLLEIDDEKDLVGKSFNEFVHPNYLSLTSKNVTGIYPIINTSLIAKNGDVKEVEIKQRYVYSDGENYCICTLRKCENTLNTISGLRQKLKLYDSIIKNIPIGVYISSNSQFVLANKEGLRILGEKNVNSILGKNINEYIHPDYIQKIDYRKKQVEGEFKSSPCEEQIIVSSDRSYIYTESTSVPIVYNGKNATLTIKKDISSKKKHEKELLESEERYRKLISLLPEGLTLQDGTTIIFANDAYAKILGYDCGEELIGKPVIELVDLNYIEKLSARVKSVMESNKIQPFSEYKLRKRDGSLVIIESSSVKIILGGQEYVLSTIRDITQRKKDEELKNKAIENKKLLEKAIEEDKLKTEFFSNISHELRTPLNIILSSIQLLSKYIDSPNDRQTISVKRYMDVMKQNCYRLLRLINNFLDITKIDTGFYNLNLSNYNIISIVEDITQSVATYLESKEIEVIFDTEVEEKIISCDGDKIERIILNLLSNAIKFTEPGGQILVSIYDKFDSVQISIKDTGIGIPEDKVNVIFDRFKQVDKSFSRNNEGTGIGLSLVKSLVELHGGCIRAYSKYGEGSEFIINLPANQFSIENEVTFRHTTLGDIDEKRIEKMNIEFSDIYTS